MLCCSVSYNTYVYADFFPANAVENEQSTAEQTQTSYKNTETPKDMRSSGDLTIEQGLSENAKIIKSVDEYYKELENDDLTIIGNVKRKKNATLPSSVDNSTSKYFPPIGNQGSLGTCVACAFHIISLHMKCTRLWMLPQQKKMLFLQSLLITTQMVQRMKVQTVKMFLNL